MKEKILNILILEDSLHDKILITEQLADAGFQFTVTHVENSHSFTDALSNSAYDIIISDFNLPEFDAFAALELCRKKCPDVPFICVSGSIGEETAVELLKKGAVDYVLKDRPERLPFAIQRALKDVEIKLIRKKTGQELRESEKRFRQVAEAANAWIWEVDTEGLYTYSSPMIEKLLGYTPEEVVGKKHFYDFYLPDDREKQKKAALQVLSQRGVFNNFENTNLKKDGSQVILTTSGSPVFDDYGNFRGYRGVDEDITEIKSSDAEQKRLLRQVERDRLALLSILEDYKKAEKQLRKLSQAVEQSPASTIITNADGIIEYVNPKFLEVTGYELGEVIGKKPNILKSGLQTNDFYKELWDTIISGKDWSGELQNKKKDGTPYWESARISPIKNEKGETLNYVAVKEDITEIKQAEYNFRQSLDQSPIGIRIESQTGETVYANNAFLEIYEMSSLSEFTNTPTEIRYDAESFLKHLERKKIRQAGGEIAEYEISIQRKSGEIRHVKVWRKEVIWNRQKHFQIINLDVTGQKLAEKALQKSEERFRIVQEISPDGFTILHPLRNEKGQVIDFEWVFENQAVAVVNRTNPETIKGKRLLELFPSHKGTYLYEMYVQVASTGKNQIIDELYVGETVSIPTWLRLVIVPLGDDIAILSQDITDRIVAENHLKESEEKYRNLIAKMMNAFALHEMIFDENGEPSDYRFLEVNPAWVRMVGLSAEKVTGKRIREMMPNIEEKWIQFYGRITKSEKSEEFEEFDSVTDKFYHIYAYCPAPGLFAVFFNDITERKKSEDKLIQERILLRTIIDSIPDGIYVKDNEGRKLLANKANCIHCGVESEKHLIGKSVFDIFPSEIAEKFSADDQMVLNNKMTLINLEEYIITTNGFEGWLSTTKVPLLNDKDEVVGLVGIGHDITERKQVEQTILKLSQAVEQSPVSVAITNKEGVIEYVNARCMHLTGYTFEEVINKKIRIFNPGKLNEKEYKSLIKSVSSGEEWRGEYQNRKKNKEFYWEQVVISPIKDSGGGIINLIVNCEDITERKKIELKLNNTLTQLQKFGSHLQKAREEEKISLAREIHDDLGQLLVAMKIDTGMTRNILNHKLTEELKNEISLKLSNHTEMITKAITSARRIMNGLRPVKLEMLGFAGAAVEYINDFSSRNNIQFETKIDTEIEKLDEERSLALYRILQESLNNVVKHANATKVEVTYQELDNELLLEISDNGVGFNIEKEGRVDSYGLLGIRERVLILNGTISIISSPGKGTRVSVNFPDPSNLLTDS